MSEGKSQNEKGSEAKTFPVPFDSEEIKENITINRNTKNKPSKEQIINQAFKFHSQGNISKASKYYQFFINQGFEDYQVFSNYGNILRDLGKLEEAEFFTRKAIELNPNFAITHSNLGNIFRDLGNLKEAEKSYRKAIELNPDFANAYSNLGNIFRDLGNLKEAEKSYRKAIELNPNFANAYSSLGLIFNDLGNFEDAINHYKKALKLNNELSMAKGGLIESKGYICEWSDQDLQTNWLKTLGIEGSSFAPFGLLCYEDNPQRHLKRSQNYYQQNYSQPEYSIPLSKNGKIHIAYFSADFKYHPVMLLLASILELHDKSKFKISLYSFVQKEDEYTQRARKSGCIFRDISKLSNIEAIALAREDQIDIAVDLMGYTKNHRFSIFSSRVAPIQVNYLGYPGSLGTNKLDYIIADKIVIPDGHKKFYNERIIRMPNCYLCTDNKMEISKESMSHKDFGLPDKGFIFTCFNSLKKITPNEFDIWMRLLTKTKDSVLWLKGLNRLGIKNLRLEAEKRNVDKNRLIFAKRLPFDQYLASHSLASLGLDTFAFNGCTTSTFGLWGGMPILTKMGESFSARFTSSLLNTMGVPELITYSNDEYEELALRLANKPDELLELKYKIKQARDKSPLFNSELFTKEIEEVYKKLINNNFSEKD